MKWRAEKRPWEVLANVSLLSCCCTPCLTPHLYQRQRVPNHPWAWWPGRRCGTRSASGPRASISRSAVLPLTALVSPHCLQLCCEGCQGNMRCHSLRCVGTDKDNRPVRIHRRSLLCSARRSRRPGCLTAQLRRQLSCHTCLDLSLRSAGPVPPLRAGGGARECRAQQSAPYAHPRGLHSLHGWCLPPCVVFFSSPRVPLRTSASSSARPSTA